MYQILAEHNDLSRRQVAGVFEALSKVMAVDLDGKAEVMATRDPGTLRHGFMIGCGDSFSAAIAARGQRLTRHRCASV